MDPEEMKSLAAAFRADCQLIGRMLATSAALGGIEQLGFMVFSFLEAAELYPEWAAGHVARRRTLRAASFGAETGELQRETVRRLVESLPISAVTAAPGEHAGEMYEG